MGHKVNPFSFRLPLHKQWQSKWYASHNYADLLHSDIAIRSYVEKKMKSAGIESVLINRGTNEINVTVKTAKPGILIGRGGAGHTELKAALEKIAKGRIRLNIEEVKKVDASAPIIAQSIATQIEKRVSFRRAMRQAIEKCMATGAKGVKISVAGRLNGAEIARTEKLVQGSVTLATLRSDIDYAQVDAFTTFGVIGIKVWVYKGIRDVTTEED